MRVVTLHTSSIKARQTKYPMCVHMSARAWDKTQKNDNNNERRTQNRTHPPPRQQERVRLIKINEHRGCVDSVVQNLYFSHFFVVI